MLKLIKKILGFFKKKQPKTKSPIRVTDHARDRYLERVGLGQAINIQHHIVMLWENKQFDFIGNNRYHHDGLIWIIADDYHMKNMKVVVTVYLAENYHNKYIAAARKWQEQGKFGY